MKIIILGPQGSGKTTQAKILAQKLGLCLVNAAQLLGEFARSGHPQSGEVQKALGEGALVDDKITASLISDRLSQQDCQSGYIVDGYPRAMESVRLYGPDVDCVLYLHLSRQQALGRLLKRGREDDTEEAIARRLQLFKERTRPVLDYYQNLGKLVTIDAAGPVAEIEAEIERSLS